MAPSLMHRGGAPSPTLLACSTSERTATASRPDAMHVASVTDMSDQHTTWAMGAAASSIQPCIRVVGMLYVHEVTTSTERPGNTGGG